MDKKLFLNKKTSLVILVIVILAVILIIENPFKKPEIMEGTLQNNENTGLNVGSLAPDFILKSLEGNYVQLSSFRGRKAVVVNFWAAWCPPCREEMPAFDDIFVKNKEQLEILGVNLQESKRAINNFLLEIPVTYTILPDPNRDVKKIYNVFTQPVTYFIDKEGMIIDKKFGPLTPKEIEDKFAKLSSEKTEIKTEIKVVEKISQKYDDIKTLKDGTKYIVHPKEILSGGPGRDGIPSIDNPKFQAMEEADIWLNDENLILGLDYKGVVRAYPHRILNWHEIVNDKANGERVLITYCPLCRTGIAFKPIVDGKGVEFGTSGKLYNAELVMYDRKTNSYWAQQLGKAILGQAAGQVLKKIPLDTARWRDWKNLHPDTEVLSRQTGFIRDYDRNPYAGFQQSDTVGFGVEFKDRRLKPKAIVYGAELGGKAKAYAESDIQKEKLVNDAVGDIPIVVVWYDELKTVKIFERKTENKLLRFNLENNEIRDDDGNKWTIEDMKERLVIVDTFGHFWFAWAAFFPETEVYNE